MRTKYLPLLFILLFFAGACTHQNHKITIKGKINFPKKNSVITIYHRNGLKKEIIDTIAIRPDSTYSYTFSFKIPGVYYLEYLVHNRVAFWAENENLEINLRGQDTAKRKMNNPPYIYIQGGPNNEVMNMLNYNYYRYFQQLVAVSNVVYREISEPKQKKRLSREIYAVLRKDMAARNIYLVKHYTGVHSILAVLMKLDPIKHYQLIDSVFNILQENRPNDPLVTQYKERFLNKVQKRKKMMLGKIAPHFEYLDLHGQKITPETFKGKFLIIDFWASWCGPCRKEIPNLKKIYAKYKNQGVEILSISIDKDENQWKKALEQEKMPWTQVRANHIKKLMSDYQFSGIPFVILLDKNGRILGKNLRGIKMEEKLNQLLKKKNNIH